MAAAHGPPSPMQSLREEAVCAICLDYFQDPVSIACGHNFCRNCVSRLWGEESARGAAGEHVLREVGHRRPWEEGATPPRAPGGHGALASPSGPADPDWGGVEAWNGALVQDLRIRVFPDEHLHNGHHYHRHGQYRHRRIFPRGPPHPRVRRQLYADARPRTPPRTPPRSPPPPPRTPPLTPPRTPPRSPPPPPRTPPRTPLRTPPRMPPRSPPPPPPRSLPPRILWPLVFRCPQCRRTFHSRSLRPNLQLANMVHIIRQMSRTP